MRIGYRVQRLGWVMWYWSIDRFPRMTWTLWYWLWERWTVKEFAGLVIDDDDREMQKGQMLPLPMDRVLSLPPTLPPQYNDAVEKFMDLE